MEVSKADKIKRKVENERHIRVEIKEAITEAKKVAATAEIDDYVHRRELQIQEAQVR